MKFKIFGIIILVVVAIQFIPYGKKHSNPAVNATTWPWYSKVAPVSWLVQGDVDEGREHFNVSMWGLQEKNKGNEAVKAVKEGEMPPWFYLIPHPKARLSDEETQELIKGLQSTFP